MAGRWLLLALTPAWLTACGEETTAPKSNELLAALGYLDEFEAPDGRPSGTRTHNFEAIAPGWNLVSVHRRAHAILFNRAGEALHAWRGPGDVWGHVELLPDGDILVPEKTKSRFELVRIGWDGTERWRVDVGAHHDVEVRPDGLVSTLSFAERHEDDIHEELKFRDESIVLLDSETGQEIERASFYDMFAAADSPFEYIEHRWVDGLRSNVDWIDLYHANSIEWMHRPELERRAPFYSAEHVLVSFRHQACVAIFNWAEKKMVWHWGRKEISGSHDATLLENGNILIFDNGLQRGWSRVIEVDPLTQKIVWEYRDENLKGLWTESRGSAQRLANGNTLLAESDRGHALEVTSAGKIVWEYFHPGENKKVATITRIKRIEPPLQQALREHLPDLPGGATN
ncbi:MAG: arylsulfotransferase family protein [Planctomycetes bacterium]|nr:arylsulfotransferase family protein [Planctomycetota bacterium]